MTKAVMLARLHRFFPIIHLLRSNYFSRGPTFVDIELSNRCNLKCRMCWFHGEKGIGDRYRNSEMTSAEVMGLINQLAAYRPHLYFGGAEPFIREDFLDLLAHAKSFALAVSFTTNATLPDASKIEKITELGVDAINVSIDGPEKLHDAIRGHGNFRKAITTLQCLLECKKRRKTRTPSLAVNITMNPFVTGLLKETVDTIREATGDGIDCFRLHHLWFVTSGELSAHKEEVHKALGVSAPGADSHCLSLSQLPDANVLFEEMSRLKDNGKIAFCPNIHGREIQAYYSDGYRLNKRCVAPFQAVVVKPNGDVKFCPDEWIDDYVLGNVRRERFETIWNNQKAKRFRSVLFRRRSFPACKRCSCMHWF